MDVHNRVNGIPASMPEQVVAPGFPLSPEQRVAACEEEMKAVLQKYGCQMQIVQTFVNGRPAEEPRIVFFTK